MRVVRSLVLVFLAAFTAIGLAFGSTIGAGVSLAATALIMGFGNQPLAIPETPAENIDQYVNLANNYFISPTHLCGDSGCNLVAVYTPEDINNFDTSNEAGRVNLDNCIQGQACTITRAPYTQTVSEAVGDNDLVIVGASQSSSVATLEKRFLQDNPPPPGTNISFVMVGNGNRPNGGLLERLKDYPGAKQLLQGYGFNVNNLTFNGSTPTDTGFTTVDVAAQYDPWVDFPTNPTNQLAMMNAYFGVLFAHGSYLFNPGTPPELQGQYGDTTYYMYPAKYVPLLQPLSLIPIVGNLYADFLDPVYRVQIEAAYDRTINPGQPTPANPNYAPDPAVFQANLAKAQLVGWDNLFQDMFSVRPFGTTRPGAYGVGGPPVYVGCGTPPCGDPTPIDDSASAQTTLAATENDVKQPEPDPKPTEPTTSNTPQELKTASLANSPSPTSTPSPTKTPGPTSTPSPTKTPSPTSTPSPTKTPSPASTEPGVTTKPEDTKPEDTKPEDTKPEGTTTKGTTTTTTKTTSTQNASTSASGSTAN